MIPPAELRFRKHSPPAAALIAVAHGSRRPAAQANIGALLEAVRAARPGLEVREAYIELASPLLPAVLANTPDEVVVVPLLLGNGYHLAHDVAGVAAFHKPGPDGVGPVCAPALGPHELLAEALADRLAEAEYCPDRCALCPPRRGPVVLAVAGSSDPRSHADADAMAALLASRLGREVVAAYTSATTPSVTEAVAALRRRGHGSVSVATYLLSPGRFAGEVKACGADVVSEPIGGHDALVRLVLNRYDGAVAQARAAVGVRV